MNFYLKIFGELYEMAYSKAPNRFNKLGEFREDINFSERKKLNEEYLFWEENAKREYAISIATKECSNILPLNNLTLLVDLCYNLCIL